MALSDLITTTLYTDKIPSSGKLIKYRPFVVKEERALMMAYESNNNDTMLVTLEDIVRSCINDASVALTSFDIEYLFTKIRTKSVEEFSTLVFTCMSCKEKNPTEIDLGKVFVENLGKVKDTIKLDSDLSIKLAYPSISELVGVTQESEIAARCVKTIYKGDQVIDASDLPDQEKIDFLDNLSSKQFELVKDFYANSPYAKIDVKWTCKKCGKDHEYELKGINDFF